MLKVCLIIFGLLVFSVQSAASDLFENDQALEIKLTGPLNSLIHHKEDEQAFPFILNNGGIEHQILARARGHSRKEICVFPPLRLEFGSAVPDESIFFGQGDLKLVTHCNKSSKSQANTLKEYAAYRFFELLSDASYRVRLLHIDYSDTEGKRSTQRWAYVIEPTGAVADRIGGDRARLPGISRKSLNDRQEALVYVFQYLIGNTDWSMVRADGDDECCHNGKLVKKDGQLLYLPYDFDLSGLVNANYAHPHPSLGIKRVTQRLYRGFCLDQEVLRDGLQTVRSHEGDFRRIVDELPALSNGAIRKVHRFLDSFFKEAAKEDKMLKSFEKRCHA